MPRSTTLDQRNSGALAEALDVAPVIEQTGSANGQDKGHSPTSDPSARVRDARRVTHSYKIRSGSIKAIRTERARLDPNAQPVEPATTTLAEQEHAQARVEILDRWDGIVVGVGDTTFKARLLAEDGGRPQADVEIFTSEVPLGDRHLIREGSVFFWHVGYRDPEGDRERVSRIRFRPLPAKTKADLRRAQRRADEIRRRVGWR
jgi:hypothetical protein